MKPFEDIDLYSKKLGATPQKQNQTVAAVMKELAVLDVAGHAGDMLGDAYEYLIGQFATDSGKKLVSSIHRNLLPNS